MFELFIWIKCESSLSKNFPYCVDRLEKKILVPEYVAMFVSLPVVEQQDVLNEEVAWMPDVALYIYQIRYQRIAKYFNYFNLLDP